MVIYTIGHSTRSWDDFVTLLIAHAIGRLADVRTIPRSRRHPHFSTEALAGALERSGIEYRHFPGLGGLRKPRPDSRNSGWREEGFRGYADYMETAEFASAITELIEWAGGNSLEDTSERGGPARASHANGAPRRSGARESVWGSPRGVAPRVVMMCAEAVWWRCHRQLTADALLARGAEVRHITGRGPAAVHQLTDFARIVDGLPRYPGLI